MILKQMVAILVIPSADSSGRQLAGFCSELSQPAAPESTGTSTSSTVPGKPESTSTSTSSTVPGKPESTGTSTSSTVDSVY